MAIQFDGLELATLPALPINPVAGEVAFDGQLKVYSGVAWETFNPVAPDGSTSTITMASGAVIEGDDGTVGAPAYTFGSDDEYGMYFDGSDTLGLTGGGEHILALTASGTPVNYWEMLSSDMGNPVQMKALGSDTNIGMELDPKGTGTVTVADVATYDANLTAASLVTQGWVLSQLGGGGYVTNPMSADLNVGGFDFVSDAGVSIDLKTALRADGNTGSITFETGNMAHTSGFSGAITFLTGDVNETTTFSGNVEFDIGSGGGSGSRGDFYFGKNVGGRPIYIYGEDSTTDWVAIKAPGSIADYTITLPAATPSATGQALVATTGGVASWASVVNNPMTADLDVSTYDIVGTPGSGGVGGNVDIIAGAANGGNFSGGTVNVTGGAGSSSGGAGPGGDVVLTGGAADGPSAQGGEVVLTEGAGSGGGDNGVIRVSGVMVAENQIRARAIYDADIGASIDILAQDNAAGAGGDVTLTAGEGGGNNDGGQAFLRGGRGSGTGDGGSTTVSAGDGGITGDGADLDLLSGSGGSTSGSGGDVNVTAGGRQAGAGNGGNINLTAGDGSATGGAAGAVFIRPGYGGSAPTIPTVSGIPQPAEFWFVDGDNTTPGYVGFKAPADVGAAVTGDGVDTVWTLPEGEGSPNQVMTTDGANILAWSSTIQGAAGFGVSGGDATLLGGDTDGVGPGVAGGNVNITGGTILGGLGSGSGGAVLIDGGPGVAVGGSEPGPVTGGDVALTGGPGGTDLGGGGSTDTSGGNIVLTGGAAGVAVGVVPAHGGNIRLEGGAGNTSGGTELGGSVELIPGAGGTPVVADGMIELYGPAQVGGPAMVIVRGGPPTPSGFAAGPPGGVPALYFDTSFAGVPDGPPGTAMYVWDATGGPPAWKAL